MSTNVSPTARAHFEEWFQTSIVDPLVAAGGGMMSEAFPNTAAVTAPGLMVLAIILFMGKVSGAHLNPAVSLAFAAQGDFPGGVVGAFGVGGCKV